MTMHSLLCFALERVKASNWGMAIIQCIESRGPKPVSRRIDHHDRFRITRFVKPASKMDARLNDKNVVVIWV